MMVQHGWHVAPSSGCGRPGRGALRRQRVKFEDEVLQGKNNNIHCLKYVDDSMSNTHALVEEISKHCDTGTPCIRRLRDTRHDRRR